jgi:hypothetical protein
MAGELASRFRRLKRLRVVLYSVEVLGLLKLVRLAIRNDMSSLSVRSLQLIKEDRYFIGFL